MNNNNNMPGVPQIGKSPKIKILKSLDIEEFEKEFDKLVIARWQPLGINHQMFYDQAKGKVIICLMCVFQSTM